MTRPVGNIQRGIIAGKLKGAMPAQTPRGTLEDRDHKSPYSCHLWLVRSMSLLIPVRVSPNIKVVFAHRDSTTWRLGSRMYSKQVNIKIDAWDISTWRPLITSPSASWCVLPCKRDQIYKRPRQDRYCTGREQTTNN